MLRSYFWWVPFWLLVAVGTLNLKMDRTVRVGLWGGEEQGLLGSAAYVKDHFADPTVMKPTPEHDKFAGYFNIDNGTGLIRGISWFRSR